MANSKEALALELRQIIQADRMASTIIDEAISVEKNIEKKTAAEKAVILAEAENAHTSLKEKMLADEEKALKHRVTELNQQYADRQKQLEDLVAQNRKKWIANMVARITAGGQAP